MARTAFSVRFSTPLADALDNWAAARQFSRSDLVESIITATTAEDREQILQTSVTGAPTEKLNLRLSPVALAHLAQLAGDLPPADFLRRTVTAALSLAGRASAGPRESAATGSPRASRRSQVGAPERPDSGSEVPVLLIGLAVVVLIVAFGFVIGLVVRAVTRASAPPPPSPGPDSRGQLDTGPPDGGGA